MKVINNVARKYKQATSQTKQAVIYTNNETKEHLRQYIHTLDKTNSRRQDCEIRETCQIKQTESKQTETKQTETKQTVKV